MTVDWDVLERRLDALFVPGCDLYRVGASILFDKPLDTISQDDRDLLKRVFMRMAARRGYTAGESSLRSAADMFHEIGSAFSAEDLLTRILNTVMEASLCEKLRSHDQLRKIATEGFELCVRALAEMGATDVTIHECGECDLEPYG